MVILLMLRPRRNRAALFRFFLIFFLDGIVLVIITIVTWRPVRTLPIFRGLDVSINLTAMLLHLALKLRTIVDILVADR